MIVLYFVKSMRVKCDCPQNNVVKKKRLNKYCYCFTINLTEKHNVFYETLVNRRFWQEAVVQSIGTCVCGLVAGGVSFTS